MPDYLIRFDNGKTLVLEVKGVDDERNRVKRAAMAVWIKNHQRAERFRAVVF